MDRSANHSQMRHPLGSGRQCSSSRAGSRRATLARARSPPPLPVVCPQPPGVRRRIIPEVRGCPLPHQVSRVGAHHKGRVAGMMPRPSPPRPPGLALPTGRLATNGHRLPPGGTVRNPRPIVPLLPLPRPGISQRQPHPAALEGARPGAARYLGSPQRPGTSPKRAHHRGAGHRRLAGSRTGVRQPVRPPLAPPDGVWIRQRLRAPIGALLPRRPRRKTGTPLPPPRSDRLHLPLRTGGMPPRDSRALLVSTPRSVRTRRASCVRTIHSARE